MLPRPEAPPRFDSGPAYGGPHIPKEPQPYQPSPGASSGGGNWLSGISAKQNPVATKALASGDSGDLKSAIYELARSGDVSYSGSLKKKSKAQLKAILESAQGKGYATGGFVRSKSTMEF